MSSAARQPDRPTSTAEFLVWPGDGTATAYELVDGTVRAMAPGSAVHAVVQATLSYLLSDHLRTRRSPCRVLAAPGIVPRLNAGSNVRVPDLAVSCGPILPGQIVVPDPILLVEILSPSNKAETWTNVWAFSTIPSVREILVVESTRVGAHLLRRQPDQFWPEAPSVMSAGDRLTLDSIGFSCIVRALYADSPLALTA